MRNDRPEKRLLTKCAGTLGYMAPEVFGARPYDGRSADLFSIGAVLHHLIVGVPPRRSGPLKARSRPESATEAECELLRGLSGRFGSSEAYDFPGKRRYEQFSEDCQSLLEHLFLA